MKYSHNPLQDAHARIRNPKTGYENQYKIGFSWTSFFFGFFVPLFRQDWKTFLILILLQVLLSVFPEDSLTGDILDTALWLGFAFLYNRLFFLSKFKEGWIPSDEESKNRLMQSNIHLKEKMMD